VPCTPLLADALERAADHPRPAVRDPFGARVLRIALLPAALVLRVMQLGDGGPFSRKGLMEAWGQTGKTSRGVLRFFIVRPARGVVSTLRRSVALARRAGRRGASWILSAPRRIVRLFRHVRYHVAVRLRGDGQA